MRLSHPARAWGAGGSGSKTPSPACPQLQNQTLLLRQVGQRSVDRPKGRGSGRWGRGRSGPCGAQKARVRARAPGAGEGQRVRRTLRRLRGREGAGGGHRRRSPASQLGRADQGCMALRGDGAFH